MTRLAVARLVLSLCLSLILAESLSAQAVPDRDVSQIWIRGLETISPRTIQRKLACLPEIVEVSHSSVDPKTYTSRVRDAVERGMLASGFFDGHVELSEEAGLLILDIQEGPRFHCGSITVEGASHEVGEWIRSQLLIASTETEDAEAVWQPDTSADGTPSGGLHWKHGVHKRLNEIGLHGAGAIVELVRNDEANSLDLHIELSSSDASFALPNQGDSHQQDADDATSTHRVSGELQQIHRRLFASPMSGIRFRSILDNMAAELVLGSETTIAMLQFESNRRTVVLDRGEVLISMEEPPAAVRIPTPNASMVLTVQSPKESNGNAIRLSFNAAFTTSDKPQHSVRAGVVFTEQCWAEWFPPDSTERTEDERGVTYSHKSHCLRLDHQGNLVELSGDDSTGIQISLDPIEEKEVRQIADEIVLAVNPIELIARDQATGQKSSLAEFIQRICKARENADDFHIPPAGGERENDAVLVMSWVHDGAFGVPDSLPARLAKLCALEMSGNHRGLNERLTEIEPEALEGPFSSAIVATLWAWHGNAEPALKQFRRAQQLTGDTDAIQHDLKLLLDSSNLLGRVCQQVDVKRLIQQSTLLAEPFFEEPEVIQSIQVLASAFPDAVTNQERCDNAQLLLTLVYEIAVQEPLEDYLADMIQLLESRHEAIAERPASDEKKR